MKKKKELTRREFLKGSAATVAITTVALNIQGCGGQASRRASVSPTPAAPTPTDQSLVGIARHESTEQAVRQAIALTSGLGFISSGDTVLLKVNVNEGDPYPLSTNPEVVAAVIKLAFEHGADRVIVADKSNPMFLPTVSSMERAGIYQPAIEAGAEVTDLDVNGYTLVNPEGAVNWPDGFRIPTLFEEVDHVINIPACKDHLMANYTMALKNWMGVIPQSERMYAHANLGIRVPELHFGVRESFIVLDATRADLTGGGGLGLTPDPVTASPGLIVATADPIACDVTGLAILKYHLRERNLSNERIDNYTVWSQPQIVHARQIGLGIQSNAEYTASSQNVPEIEELMNYINV